MSRRRLVIGRSASSDATAVQKLIRPSLFTGGSLGSLSGYRRRDLIKDGGEKEPAVATVISAVAQDVANPEFRMVAYQPGTEDDITRADSYAHAWNEAPSPAMSAHTLRTIFSHLWDYTGEMYLLETKVAGTDDYALTPLVGGVVEVVPAKRGETYRDGSPKLVAGYIVRNESGQEVQRYPEPGPLIRVWRPDPADFLSASPVIKGLGVTIDTLNAQRLATLNLLRNNGQIPGILSVSDPDGLGIEQEDLDTLEQKIGSKLRSTTGRVLVIDGQSMSYQELAQSVIGKDWLESMTASREELMTHWAMPPARLGLGGGRTYENQRVEMGGYYKRTPKTRHDAMADAFSHRARVLRRNVRYRIDATDVPEMQEDASEKAKRAAILFNGGIVSQEEARELNGLPPEADPSHTFKSRPGPVAVTAPVVDDEPEPDDDGGGDDPPPQPAPDATRAAAGTERTDEELAAIGAALETAGERASSVMATHAQNLLDRVFSQVRGALLRSVGDDPAAPVAGIDAARLLDRSRFDREVATDAPGWYRDVAAELVEPLAAAWGATVPLAELAAQATTDRQVEWIIGARDGWDGLVASLASDVAEAAAQSDTAGELLDALQRRWDPREGTRAEPAPVSVARDVLGRFARARLIGVSEAHAWGNAAGAAIARAAGSVEVKTWHTVGDERVRGAHQAAHGQRVPVWAKFRVDGEALAYPRDPAGSAGNTINCRCWSIAAVMRVAALD